MLMHWRLRQEDHHGLHRETCLKISTLKGFPLLIRVVGPWEHPSKPTAKPPPVASSALCRVDAGARSRPTLGKDKSDSVPPARVPLLHDFLPSTLTRARGQCHLHMSCVARSEGAGQDGGSWAAQREGRECLRGGSPAWDWARPCFTGHHPAGLSAFHRRAYTECRAERATEAQGVSGGLGSGSFPLYPRRAR